MELFEALDSQAGRWPVELLLQFLTPLENVLTFLTDNRPTDNRSRLSSLSFVMD